MENKSEQHIELFTKFLSGESTRKEYEQLLSWLNESAENREEFFNYQKIWNKTNKPLETFFPDSEQAWKVFSEKNGIVQEKLKVTKSHHYSISSFYKAAAVLLMGIGLAITLKMVYFSKDMVEISAGNDQVKKVVLPDSSEVWLNKNSQITYSENFNLDNRVVNLTGEAFFEVKKAEGRRFTIYAGNSKTEVVGTSFNIKENENSEVEVAVATGRVAFSPKNEDRTVFLLPGEKASVGSLKNITKQKIENENFRSWQNNQLTFNDVVLNQVFNTLEQHYAIDMDIKSPTLLNCHYTGNFKELTIEEVMEILAASANFSYQESDGVYHISGEGCDPEM
ncbi:FecR family protein [Flexithrix dorotheae]|uniref:FecR family protein n=1 Tax=Flexithrix dorotheae TaxID=70993 RepID=UPI000376E329|nr:FecR family protein [Flexithrix dorotheae]